MEMDRLTYWNNKEKGSALPAAINDNGDTVDLETLCAKLATYEDTGLEPSEIQTGLEMANVYAAMQELKRYKDAEEQGLLVRLPCNTGRTVHITDNGKIVRCATENTLVRNGLLARVIGENKGTRYAVYTEDMGKTVFLTREAAEAALAKMTNTAK